MRRDEPHSVPGLLCECFETKTANTLRTLYLGQRRKKMLRKPDVIVIRIVCAVGIFERVEFHGHAVWDPAIPEIRASASQSFHAGRRIVKDQGKAISPGVANSKAEFAGKALAQGHLVLDTHAACLVVLFRGQLKSVLSSVRIKNAPCATQKAEVVCGVGATEVKHQVVWVCEGGQGRRGRARFSSGLPPFQRT